MNSILYFIQLSNVEVELTINDEGCLTNGPLIEMGIKFISLLKVLGVGQHQGQVINPDLEIYKPKIGKRFSLFTI